MRAKKLIFSGILITTAMLFLGSCGKPTESANAEPTETVKEADEENVARLEGAGNSAPAATEKPAVTAEPTQTPAPVATEKPAETAEPTQTPAPAATEKPSVTAEPTQTPAPAATEKPAETAEPTQTSAPVATEKPAETAKPTQTPAPAVTDAPVKEPNTEQPIETQKPVPPAQSEVPAQPETPAQPSQPEQPAHQHIWQDHVATTQTWIPNIVVVEDYGEIPGESYDYFVCSCGYETEDADAIRTHYKEGVIAGTCINFGIQTRYRESTYGVIGTHEEDQGHYETSSYVDYQYCDCGETK